MYPDQPPETKPKKKTWLAKGIVEHLATVYVAILVVLLVGAGSYAIHARMAASATCTTNFTPASYNATSVANAATGGAVLCLGSGTYSAIELISLHPGSMVTMQPAAGASVSLGKITLTGASNLTITGFSGSSSSGGLLLQGQYQGVNTSITFSYNAMTTNGVWIDQNNVANANINIDHNTFIGFASSGEQDRMTVNTANSGKCPNGVTISNNLMKGGESDGIDIDGGTCGTKIVGNEITGILEQNCGGIHCDAMQDNGGGMQTWIEGNYLHGNSDGLLFDDGNIGPDTIKNNVFDNPTYRCIEGQYGDSSVFTHNTFNCEVNVGQDHSGTKTTNLTFTNNVFGNASSAGFSFYPGLSTFGSFKALDYNVHTSGQYDGATAGAHDKIGSPTFAGGTNPTTLAGFALTSGSLGHAAASDGTDMGADVASLTGGGSSSDTTAPTVSISSPSSGATVNGSNVTIAATASDNVAIDHVEFYVDGTQVGTDSSSPYSISWDSRTVANGSHTIQAKAYDSSYNLGTSSTVSVTTNNTSVCTTSSSSWQNQTFSAQSGSFTFDFDATPNASGIDSVTGLSSGSATDFTNLATIVRFNTTGTIDARNGDNYAATSTVNYTAGTTYHIKVTVNLPNHTYSVDVTPTGGSTTTIASGYAFRTEQASVTSLNDWATNSVSGTHTVCGATVAPVTGGSKAGDFNNDGVVNSQDLSLFTASWKQTGTGIVEDMNSDGAVNVLDLSKFLGAYGR